jgi:ribonuclease Z
MPSRFPFRKLEPAFFSGLLDDPVLYVGIRPMGRGLLFDCGRIHHLAKRVLKSLDALFISHAHMDHFMGMDTFIRSAHVTPRIIDIYGPPGLAGKTASKLAAYDWNLAEAYWCSFRVHEVYGDCVKTSLFSGPEGFVRTGVYSVSRSDRIVYRNRHLTVESESCDHKIPSLAFRVSEISTFVVDEERLARAGLVKGDWLRVLKKHLHGGSPLKEPLRVLHRRNNDIVEEVADPEEVYGKIRGKRPEAAIGYLADVGFCGENLRKIVNFMKGVTLLACECSFLCRDKEKARISAHLCTDDVNVLVEAIRPEFFLPMHLSKSYIHSWETLYDELVVPPGVALVRLPQYLTPRPLLPCEAKKFAKPE